MTEQTQKQNESAQGEVGSNVGLGCIVMSIGKHKTQRLQLLRVVC